MTLMKIFRPWTLKDDDDSDDVREAKCESRTEPPRHTIFTRVPDIGYPASKFTLMYENPWQGLPIAFEDWSNAVQMLQFPTTAAAVADSIAQNSSYLESTYLNLNLSEMYGNVKVANKLKQKPKKFRCPHCKVAFSNNGQLKGHVRIHTGERPFKCDSEKCGKSFTRNEELTRHKRIHTGLRPFPCEQCGKRFGRKDHLKKHIRTHFPQPRFIDANLVSLYPLLFGY